MESNTDIQSTKKRLAKKLWWIVGGAIVAVALVSVTGGLINSYRAFKREVNSYFGVSLGDDAEQVRYRLGVPTSVVTNNVETRLSWMEDDIGLPPGRKLADFEHWKYSHLNREQFAVHFHDGKVFAVICYSVNASGCTDLAHVGAGNTEEHMLGALGEPTSVEVKDGEKAALYDIGLRYVLVQDHVESVALVATPQRGKFGPLFRRWVASLTQPVVS